MSNKYFSIERRFHAKGVYQAAINPPADFTIVSGAFLSSLISIDQQAVNPHSNIIINRIGLYSNFADGLVYKNVGDRVLLGLTARSYRIDTGVLTGNFNITCGSKDVTGAGTAFDTELVDDDVFTNGGLTGLTGTYLYRVNGNPPDATNLTLHDWPEQSISTANMRKLLLSGSDTFRRIEINSLNEMISLDEIMLPAGYAGGSADIAYVSLEVSFLNSAGISWLTKSINTGFAGDSCFFDVAVELEFTSR